MATTLIQLLEELSDYERPFKIPAAEVDRLVNLFGDRIRRMGRWNVSGDRSLEIPEGVLRQAAIELSRLSRCSRRSVVQRVRLVHFSGRGKVPEDLSEQRSSMQGGAHSALGAMRDFEPE